MRKKRQQGKQVVWTSVDNDMAAKQIVEALSGVLSLTLSPDERRKNLEVLQACVEGVNAIEGIWPLVGLDVYRGLATLEHYPYLMWRVLERVVDACKVELA